MGLQLLLVLAHQVAGIAKSRKRRLPCSNWGRASAHCAATRNGAAQYQLTVISRPSGCGQVRRLSRAADVVRDVPAAPRADPRRGADPARGPASNQEPGDQAPRS